MHTLEAYANNIGVKLNDKPSGPIDKFFPINGKYVVIYAPTYNNPRHYSYYAEVVKYTKNILNQQNINIVQIGLENDSDIGANINLNGKTSFSQVCYLIKNSLCYIGNDSVWMHTANTYGVNIVALFGPTLPKVSGPYFQNAKVKILESHRNGQKATLSMDDPINSINLITPEDISNALFDILEIPDRIEIKTIKIGALFSAPFLEIDLSREPLINIHPDIQLNLRLDWQYNLYIALKLAQTHNISIITDQKIDIGFLNAIKNRVVQILFEINSIEEIDMEYIKALFSFGKTHIISDLKGQQLNDLKFKLFDYFAIAPKVENQEPLNIPNLFFKNSGGIISGDKKYPTQWHLENEIYNESGEYEVPDTDNKTFWLYKEFLHFYEKTV